MEPDHSYTLEEGSESDESLEKTRCDVCKKKFARKSGLLRHRRDQHGLGYELRRSSFRCLESNCEATFVSRKLLLEHLSEEHKKEIDVQVMHFATIAEFEEWKTDYEQNHCVRFLRKVVRTESKTIHYGCNRSGTYTSFRKGLRRPKLKGSCKSGNHCTAGIVVKEIGGKLEAEISFTHYGHDIDLSQIHLSKEDKKVIADKLRQGNSMKSILASLKRSVRTKRMKRIALTTKKDLENIVKSYGIPRKSKKKPPKEIPPEPLFETDTVFSNIETKDDVHYTDLDLEKNLFNEVQFGDGPLTLSSDIQIQLDKNDTNNQCPLTLENRWDMLHQRFIQLLNTKGQSEEGVSQLEQAFTNLETFSEPMIEGPTDNKIAEEPVMDSECNIELTSNDSMGIAYFLLHIADD